MRGSSSRNQKIKRLTNITVLFALIIGAGFLLPKVFSFVGTVVLYPVQAVNQWYETSEQMLPTMMRDKAALQDRISELENELIISSGDDLTLRRLQDENSSLRALLNSPANTRTLAKVIARPGDIPYDLVQIDQGSNAGIKEDALVYIGSDQLIGSVVQVRSSYSFVQLFTTPGVEMTGFISGPDVVATIEGVGGGVARVRVPQGVPIAVGDIVYVPSINPGLFGEINFIENRPSQPEQYGYITLRVPMQSLHEVGVDNALIEQATVESIAAGKEQLIEDRLLIEEAHTVSFEELLSTSTPTTTDLTEETP